MYERLKRLYDAKRLGVEGILNAVDKGWLTEDEAREIIGEEDGENG